MKYQRRTDDDRIAELNAKIEGIRDRAARKAARANPAVRQATVAVRAIEKALEGQPGDPLGPVLEQARVTIRAALDGAVSAPEPVVEAPRKPRRRATSVAT